MNLQAQIELITNPQEFTRLYDAVLIAEHGDDYLPVDDDRSDKGNDGYLKSEKRLFAGHCFKRIQKQAIDEEIWAKVSSDLDKAGRIKASGRWDVQAWTLLTNYPLPESIAHDLESRGEELGISVSWKGPAYFAQVLQKYKELRSSFPNLQVNEVMERIDFIIKLLESPETEKENIQKSIERVPRTQEELKQLLIFKPEGWEYLYFSGVMLVSRDEHDLKWHDYEIGYARPTGQYINDFSELAAYIGRELREISKVIGGITLVFKEGWQLKAFGEPGQPGVQTRIEHMAKHVTNAYLDMLDWTAKVRGVTVPDKLRDIIDTATAMTEGPIQQIRDFIDEAVRQTDAVPAYIKNPDPNKPPMSIELNLVLSIDDNTVKRLKRALKKHKWGF